MSKVACPPVCEVANTRVTLAVNLLMVYDTRVPDRGMTAPI